MVTLAQYAAQLHEAPEVERPAPGRGTRWAGLAIYASAAALVIAAALQAA